MLQAVRVLDLQDVLPDPLRIEPVDRGEQVRADLTGQGPDLHAVADVVDEVHQHPDRQDRQQHRHVDRQMRNEVVAAAVARNPDGAQHQQAVQERRHEDPEHELVATIGHEVAHQPRTVRRGRQGQHRDRDRERGRRDRQRRARDRTQEIAAAGLTDPGDQDLEESQVDVGEAAVHDDQRLGQDDGEHAQHGRQEPEALEQTRRAVRPRATSTAAAEPAGATRVPRRAPPADARLGAIQRRVTGSRVDGSGFARRRPRRPAAASSPEGRLEPADAG